MATKNHTSHAWHNRYRNAYENRIRGTSKTIGSIVRGFKIGVTKWFRLNGVVNEIWQRNYYDHIIRDQKSLSAHKYGSDQPDTLGFYIEKIRAGCEGAGSR